MKLFQRFEVWLLLVLAVVSMVVVFKPWTALQKAPPAAPSPSETTSDAPLQVRTVTIVRDYGNARLDVDARIVNHHAKKLQLRSPVIKLLAGKDHEVPDFILPVEPVPEVPPKATADVRLRYWLERSDLVGTLTLTFDGESAILKSDRPFDLNQLENTKPRVMKAEEW
jgi:hypothetical protein